jgi:hypothetical protein
VQISIGTDKNEMKNFKVLQVKNSEELAKVITETNYSLGIFKDGLRNKANFISTEAIGLDFDAGYTLEQAKTDFAEYSHIIAPSKSHRVEKNGLVSDRFRVILFLKTPITDVNVFESTWHSLFEKWPQADKACKDASRFFYPSQSIEAIRKGGKLIEVVLPKPKSEPKVANNLDYISPSVRGTIARETIKFLETGVESGGRNHATHKAAKEFQQAMYTLEEAESQIVEALNANGTIANDFTESEVLATIRSAYNTEAKHEARITPKAFNLKPLSELYKTKADISWLVDGLLAVGGVSLMASDPKSGKSTIARQLMRDIIRGGNFFGRKCKQGTVHYYALEEQLEVLNKSFQRLGLDGTEPLFVHIGDPLTDAGFEDFKESILEHKPALAVVDTMFDLIQVESENNYKDIKRELRKVRKLARESGTHILLIHHNSKGSKDDKRRGNRSILGSTAIAGGVDTIMVIEVDGKTRIINTSGRETKDWYQRELVFDFNDRTYSLGPDTSEEF